eukprot:403332620
MEGQQPQQQDQNQQQPQFQMGADPNQFPQQYMMGGGFMGQVDPNMMMQMQGFPQQQYGGYQQPMGGQQFMGGYGMGGGYGQQMGGNSAYGSKSHFQRAQGNDPAKYKTVMCRHFQTQGQCTLGDKCSFAHGEHELRKGAGGQVYQPKQYGSDNNGGGRGGYVPRGGRGGRGGFQNFNTQGRDQTFKTALCKNFEQGNCKYGDKCSFAHGDHELKKGGSPSGPGKFNLNPPPVPGLAGFQGIGGMPPAMGGLPVYGQQQYGMQQMQPQLQQNPLVGGAQVQANVTGDYPSLGNPNSQ